ncbi:MAG: DUF2147 domain-containing protein [Chitinophagales bacterium]|nr:DUF2147 domain-containing protein [Chitinophagales bacterium]
MKIFTSVLFSVLFAFSLSAQSYSDAIIGKWKSEDKKTVVEIYKQGNVYLGKIVWIAQPIDTDTGKPRTDIENPDPAKRNVPLIGLVVMRNLQFKDGFWKDGEIYNSGNGETYDGDIWLENNDLLKMKAYWYFMSQTESWTREK